MEEDNEELLVIAKYIKDEFKIYFRNKPLMYKVLKRITIEKTLDKYTIVIPDEIYNISYVTDRLLIEKCVESGIKRYMNENNVIGSVY